MLLLLFKIFAAIIRWSSDSDSLVAELLLIIMEAILEWLLKDDNLTEDSPLKPEQDSSEVEENSSE